LKRDCFILPQGINQPEFTNVKASFGANFISIGVIHQRKGHHLLIAAFKILQQQLPQATLTIIGNKTDATYLEKLLAMCQGNASITIKVNASRQEIITALGQASIFVLHSYEESQGISLCEAMACGLPVVATNIGGIPFVIDHQQQGLLSAYGDVDSFANNMMRLANDQSLWQSYHNSCLVKANDFYWQNINDKMQQRLTQL
jgi:glycosyltransferase involved in cell wall biosynthesis